MSEILNDLGRRVVRGDHPVGSLLPTEAELCRIYSVGRNTAREVIKTLVGKQLVRTGRGSGTVVLPREEWNLLDPQVVSWRFDDSNERCNLTAELTHLRLILEPAASAAAAERATTTQILRIFEAYEQMEGAVTDREAAILADRAFHLRVFDAANNPLLLSMARPLGMLLTERYKRTPDFNGEDSIFRKTLPHHRRIAEAIHARDPAAAQEATIELLQVSHDEMLREPDASARDPAAEESGGPASLAETPA